MQTLADASAAGRRTAARRCPGCLCDRVAVVTEQLDEGAFYRCPGCGLRYVDPLPAAAPIFPDFSEYAGKLHTALGEGNARPPETALLPMERRVLEGLTRIERGSAVLELCAESGRFAAAVRERGFRPLLLDPVPAHVSVLRRHGFDAACGMLDALHAQWPEPSAVIILESLVRIPEPALLLARIREGFPRSSLHLTIPSPLQSLKLLENERRYDYPPHHLTRWDRQSLEALLHRAGYRARVRSAKVRWNWPARRSGFGNAIAVALRMLRSPGAEFSLYATAEPR